MERTDKEVKLIEKRRKIREAIEALQQIENETGQELDDLRQEEANQAFNKAVKEGRLTTDLTQKNWLGNYMFMGRYNGRDNFKNKDTRQYDV